MARSLTELPLRWKATAWVVVAAWVLIAIFPILWLAVMAVKLPIDAFAPNALTVIFGPATRSLSGGLSLTGLVLIVAFVYLLAWIFSQRDRWPLMWARAGVRPFFATLAFYLGWLGVGALGIFLIGGPVVRGVESLLAAVPGAGWLSAPVLGLTFEHIRSVWIDSRFYVNFVNSMIVTAGVVTISLTIGALAAYGLARTRTAVAFWILIAALAFRALPHSTLVTGYLPTFLDLGLYGKRIAVIVVLVAINQPFTIWMLRSFFMNIPPALDEAALVDGCNRIQAFWHVIMPVMWPGVITTGLFSFMLAYNDFLVAALLLEGPTQTMVPAIMQYFNRETTLTDQLEAIAAAVSITGPLLILVLFFQRYIVAGLTSGSVKG